MWVEEGVVFCIYKENTVFTLKVVETAVKERFSLAEGHVYTMFADIKGLKYATKEARAYLKTKGTGKLSAGAFLINSSIVEIIGNYFIKLDKPSIPTKLFTDQKKALEWLERFKNQIDLNQ